MKSVVFISQASFELADAASGYDATRVGLGRDFFQQVDQALMRVVAFPDMGAQVGGPFRRTVLHQFPFSIIYRASGSHIQVLAILPTYADPARLQSELASGGKS